MKQYSLTILCLLSLFIVSCTSSHNPKRTTNGTVQTNGTTQNDELPDELPFDLANRGDSYTHTPQQVVNALKCQVAYEQCKSAPIRKVPFYVSFDTNKASLNRKGRKALEELSIAFEREKSLFIRNRLIIAGHTDSRGKEWYNMQLSEKRALTVKNYLANELGISSSHFIAEGYGEEQPIEKNDTPQKRARNRRVEFRLFNSN